MLHATAPQPNLPAARCQAGTAPAPMEPAMRCLFGGVWDAMGGIQHGLSGFRSVRPYDDYGSVSALRHAARSRDDKNKDNKKKKDRNSNKGGDSNGVTVNASGGVATSSSQSNQTVVNANNQVCAGNCAQTNQQVVTMDTTQTTLAGSQEFFGTPPTYWIDVTCNFDAPKYRTICDCTGHGVAGAPPVRKITLAPADICAVVISEETRVVQERERTREGGSVATGGEANAGNGGVANADASGGSVTVG